MRSVSLRRTEPVQVEIVMAQTSATRNRLLQRMLTYSAIPQALLLIFLAWWLRRSIGRDLGPLATLQQALGRRDASDLGPVPDDATTDGNSRDVDNLRLALNSLLLRLSRSIDAQREFAGNVAHELRTPLAGIRAQASYALAQQTPTVWHEQLLGIAEGEQRASHLVEQLLALARADEGRAALQLQPLPLDELVRDVVLRFMPKADSVGVDLGAEGLEQPTTVVADVALVEGILGNLLDNALRYAAGPDARVTVSVWVEGAQTVLRVVDNGPGMSPQDLLFWDERWALGEAGQRLGQGVGLGLSIVRRYAELLGADFSLAPGADGRGLCASLRLKSRQT
jgi:two-component system sensor histidine kinase TctE